MNDLNQHALIRYGVVLIGLVLLYSAIRGLWTGRTTGYYKDHVYSRDSEPAAFYRWVTLRATFGAVSLALAFLLP